MTSTMKFGWFCGHDVPRRVRGLRANTEVEAAASQISCPFRVGFGQSTRLARSLGVGGKVGVAAQEFSCV